MSIAWIRAPERSSSVRESCVGDDKFCSTLLRLLNLFRMTFRPKNRVQLLQADKSSSVIKYNPFSWSGSGSEIKFHSRIRRGHH